MQNMNVILAPTEQCLVHLEYKLNVDRQSKRSLDINWLGFDKFGSILYGVRENSLKINDKQIMLLSAISGQIKIVKDLHFGYPVSPPHFFRETTAISSCGECIGIVHYPYQNNFEKAKDSANFYLFSIEKCELEIYNLLLPFEEVACPFLKLLNSSSKFGWICIVVSNENLSLQRFVFNEIQKTCALEFLTHFPQKNDSGPFPTIPNTIVCEKDVLVFSERCDCVDIFNFATNSWYCNKFGDFPTLTNEYAKFVIGSQDGKKVIAVPYSMKSQTMTDYPFYELVDNCWKKLSIYIKTTPPSNNYIWAVVKYACCSSNFVLTKIPPRDIFCVSINVLSLKNLSMKQIFATCQNFNQSQLIEITNLPCILKRQFFGPSWMWKV